MVDFIVRFADGDKECFVGWSTISDGPTTTPGSEADLRAHIQKHHGLSGLRDIDARLARCRHRGHSMHCATSLEEELNCNRAGRDETRMTVAQMVQYFLHDGGKGEPPIGDWPEVIEYDFGEGDDPPEGAVRPGDREWTCHRHGVHPLPFCPVCSAEARQACDGDR
jgi:hypothetical protein